MTKIILLALLVSSPLFAQESETAAPAVANDTPVITTEAPEEDTRFNPYKSHWITTFGFEGMKYETLNEFQGEKNSFSPNKQELWGGRIGFGGEIYLGKGIMTTSKIEGYYMGTLFSRVLNGGDEDDDVKFAYTKRTGQIYGIDASQALGFIFDFKTKNPFMDEWAYLTIEPYVEAGIGYARAYNRTNYKYDLEDTNDPSNSTDEAYRLRVEDQLTNAKVGAGVNFTSTSGYFFYMKVTQNRYDITDRKASRLVRPDGGPNTVTKPELSDKIDAVTVYALGGGYKF